MKKFALIFIITATMAGFANAQTRSRVFDNFDTNKGVNVVSPSVTPIVSSRSTSAKVRAPKVRKTSSVSSGLGLKGMRSSNGSRVPSMRMGTGKSLGQFSTGDPKIDKHIEDACKRFNMDPLLIYSQMHQESAFKKRARSHKGASGLMQLMPATARRFGVKDIYDPGQNIHAGVRYMRWLLKKFNYDIVLALAGYNAGEGAVMKYGNKVPPYRETQDYVVKITKRYRAISNPKYMRNLSASSSRQVAQVAKSTKSKSRSIYKSNVMTVKLPDGRVRLVN